ncbi:MAG: integration host factor subunit beta [Hyphomicrobiales bacterium]|jgi:integration host factor subunit beta|nr:integration host factor subunit beta [Alphaproteobacteria bacterium]
MKRSELVDELAKEYPHLYHRDIEKVVDVFYSSIADALANGQRVELRGFGAFSIKERGPRIARNPKNGDRVAVSSKKTVYYKPGKELKERINK